jgi:hypothetical protein
MSPGPDVAEAPGSRTVPRILDGASFGLLVFAGLRILLSVVGVAFVDANPPNPGALAPGSPPARFTQPATPGVHNAIDGMQRWDASWFEWIAEEGYGSDDARGAFFPGTSILIRAAALVTPLDAAGAATLVSNVSFALALIVLLALTRYEFAGAVVARRSVVLFGCLPTSFFFLAPLSEAPFLLASLLAFFWARTGRWGWRVAVAGFAACLVRSIGVALVIALLLEAVRQEWSEHRRPARVAVAAAGLLAPAAYVVWWWSRGDALQPLRAQAYWDRDPSFPLVTVVDGLRAAWRGATSGDAAFLLVDAVVAMLAVAAAVVVWRRMPRSYAVYVWLSLLIPLCYAVPSRPLLSIPRFVAVLFPIAWVGERLVHARPRFALLVALCLVWQVALAAEFMNLWWIF